MLRVPPPASAKGAGTPWDRHCRRPSDLSRQPGCTDGTHSTLPQCVWARGSTVLARVRHGIDAQVIDDIRVYARHVRAGADCQAQQCHGNSNGATHHASFSERSWRLEVERKKVRWPHPLRYDVGASALRQGVTELSDPDECRGASTHLCGSQHRCRRGGAEHQWRRGGRPGSARGGARNVSEHGGLPRRRDGRRGKRLSTVQPLLTPSRAALQCRVWITSSWRR